jgi:hypothetical protein
VTLDGAAHPYPPAPWRTHGRAWFASYLVRASEIAVPPPLTIDARFGWTLGALGVVEYLEGSPLVYREVVWMPARVSARVGGASARGFFVSHMVVDSRASVTAGRELWALPKQLAKIDIDGTDARARVTVEVEDGARLTLEVRGHAPITKRNDRIATLQPRGDGVVRFRGSTSARVGLAEVRCTSGAEAWAGLQSARRLPLAGAAMPAFETTMHEPETLGR